MNLAGLRRMYAQMEWGDALVWRGVLDHQPSAEDPFVRESLLHLHGVQRAYLTGWTGGTPSMPELDDFDSLEELRAWGRGVYPELSAFVDGLEESDLGVKTQVLWADMIERMIGRPPVHISLADMMLQVATHSVHHRAQVNRRIRELGGDPAFIDYVAWAWSGDPPAEWA